VSAEALLVVEDIHTYYGEAHILQGVSIAVGAGEVVTLIGRNGAGKTTTLRSIMGIARPRSGRIALAGEEISRRETHEIVRRGIAWVPEERRVLPNLTVLENLRLGMMTPGAGNEAAARIEEFFDMFPRLRERTAQKGRFLSGGEQQMLAIARALMSRPRLLLLDEPSLGLAPLIVREIFSIIKSLNAEGVTILLVEQNAHLAMQHSHRAYVLETGQLVISGPARQLLDDERVLHAYLGG